MKDITNRRLMALKALQDRGADMNRLECKRFIFSGKLPLQIEKKYQRWKDKE